MRPGADTYLLFVVGEFTLLVLLLGFVVIHSESDSLVALTRAVFFLLWRLSFLFRSVLLLLLQDSTFQRAPTDRRTVRVRPLTRASRYFGDINDKYKFIYFFFLKEGNGEREEKVSCEWCFLRSQIFLAIPWKASPEALVAVSPKRNTVNVRRTAPQANFSPLFSV